MAKKPTPKTDEILIVTHLEEIAAMLTDLLTEVKNLLSRIGPDDK
jgi:hypothetical protein